jgi:uncharacterized protein with HEPN domain
MDRETINELLADVLEACSDILEDSNISQAEFTQDKRRWKSVIRDFGVIGEAASKLPAEFRKAHAEVDWRHMKDMRNRLIHDYQGIDLYAVHRIAQTEIPKVITQIETILRCEE